MPLMRPFISCFMGQKVFFMVYEAVNKQFFIDYGHHHSEDSVAFPSN